MAERRTLKRRDVLRIGAIAGVGTALGVGLVSELLRQAALHRVSLTRTRLGTLVTITVVHPDPSVARGMVDEAFTEMTRLEAILSRYRPDSPLSRLNTVGRIDRAPSELLHVMTQALDYARMSGGAFDPTVAPLLKLYTSRAERGEGLPDVATVAHTLRLVGYEGVHITGTGVAFDHPGMSVTLDGIAKGYIVDRTVATLVGAGADRVLVDAGGDMASGGEGSVDEPWTVAVQDPRDVHGAVDLVHLAGGCIATSGDYLQWFTEDRTAHHIIDPRTGRSPIHTASVSVVADSAMTADALSTAVMVLGPEAGVRLLEPLDSVEGLVVNKSGEALRTRGFATD
jgi:thiamine biosynthesis lipoprotein